MAKAVYNGKTIAESKDTKVIDGSWYFPKRSLNKKYLRDSATHLISADKGEANFYNIYVNDKINWNAAWYYPQPKKEIKEIKNLVGFGPSVKIEN
jgi:uncharacterized protein (DUF427 family)